MQCVSYDRIRHEAGGAMRVYLPHAPVLPLAYRVHTITGLQPDQLDMLSVSHKSRLMFSIIPRPLSDRVDERPDVVHRGVHKNSLRTLMTGKEVKYRLYQFKLFHPQRKWMLN